MKRKHEDNPNIQFLSNVNAPLQAESRTNLVTHRAFEDDKPRETDSLESGFEGYHHNKLSNLPHNRENCLIHNFVEGNYINACPQCYCFICGTLHSECANWQQHCSARSSNPADRDLVRKFQFMRCSHGENDFPRIPLVAHKNNDQFQSDTSNALGDDNLIRDIRLSQKRLILLRHACICPHTLGKCPVTKHCTEMKVLWAHMLKCNNLACNFPNCLLSRRVLSHYDQCQENNCPVCSPVRKSIKQQPNKNYMEVHTRTHPYDEMATNVFPVWYDAEKHFNLRRRLSASILEVLHKRRPHAPREWVNRLPQIACKLEILLLRVAVSRKQYEDPTTLTQRLENMAGMCIKAQVLPHSHELN